MNKILIAVFDSEKAAYEGLAALKDLHKDGDISLYASSVVAKDAAGAGGRPPGGRTPVRSARSSGSSVARSSGCSAGRPAPSSAVARRHAAGSCTTCSASALASTSWTRSRRSLTPGKVAVVADVDESWITPVDTRLEAMGATTFRRYRGEMIGTSSSPRGRGRRGRVAAAGGGVRAGRGRGRGEGPGHGGRAASEGRSHRRPHRHRDQAGRRLSSRLDSATLQAQLEAAREEQRNRIQARIDETKATHKARQEKLEEARKHAKTALELTGEAIRA